MNQSLFKIRLAHFSSVFLIAIIFIAPSTFANNSQENLADYKLKDIHFITDYSSDTATAIFSSRNSLVLDTTVPLVRYYVANITALGFPDPLSADIFFNNISDNLLSYKVNHAKGTVVIHLHLQYANPSWNVNDWNNYIQKKLNP